MGRIQPTQHSPPPLKTLYLFPDTNVFLQCKPLDQLSWAAMGDFDEIELVVTRPVQKEIDALKGKGNSRQAARARAAASLINLLLDCEDHRHRVRDGKPVVHLRLDLLLRPEKPQPDSLDYEQHDDQLVGIVLGYQNVHPDVVVKLLTDDSGPKFSAKTVGVKFQSTPSGWLLPPEEDEATKRANALKSELDLYKRQEPNFKVTLKKPQGSRLEISVNKYEPLTAEEVDSLMTRLQEDHPLVTSFSEAQPKQHVPKGPFDLAALAIPVGAGMQPVAPADIEHYRKRYDEWLQDCRAKLTNLPKALHQQLALPETSVTVENVGSRPAEDALVVAEFEGPFGIGLPKKKSDDEPERSPYQRGTELANPPRPPETRPIGKGPYSIASLIKRSSYPHVDTKVTLPHVYRPPEPRDPNAFYLKVGSRGAPLQRIVYACDQWRHGQRAEDFDFELWFHTNPGTHSGVVKLGVHAANLTQPVRINLPVSITVNAVSCLTHATAMVDAVKGPSRYRLAITE